MPYLGDTEPFIVHSPRPFFDPRSESRRPPWDGLLSDTALRAMKFTDAVDANGVPLQGAALFAARAEHRLVWEDADQQDGWQTALPELVFHNTSGAFESDVYGLARLLLLVKIDDSAARQFFAAKQLAPPAWGRILGAAARLMTPAAPGMPTAAWLRFAEAALLTAPTDILTDLTVIDADLLDTEPDQAGHGRGQPTAPQVMKLITWGDLADDSGRLGPAGEMLYYVDSI